MNPRGADLLKLYFHSQTNGFRTVCSELATLLMQKQSEISFARISHTSREEGGETDLKHSIVQRELDAHWSGLFRLVSRELMMKKRRKEGLGQE